MNITKPTTKTRNAVVIRDNERNRTKWASDLTLLLDPTMMMILPCPPTNHI
jgi:hypothetical protein